jgi:DNA segregation ATPase FtsK/SpoIIIE, S-DNA-T family
MRKVVTGEQVAQIYNRDPFAQPVWRAPVYQTPAIFTIAVQVYRLVSWLVRLIARHPLAAGILALAVVTWADLGWVTLAALAAAVVVVLAVWRWFWRSRSPGGSLARPGEHGGDGGTGAAGPGC